MIQELIDDLQADKILMKEAFDRAKVIAVRNDDSDFISWLDFELFGYNKNDIPPYRIIKCTTNIKINTLFNFTLKKNDLTKIDRDSFTDNEKKIFNNCKIIVGISEIQKLCSSHNTSIISLPENYQDLDDLKDFYDEEFPKMRFIKLSITREVSRELLIQLINKVRHKLIESLSKYKVLINPENSLTTKQQAKEDDTKILNNIYISLQNNNNQTMSNDKYVNEGQTGSMGPNNTVHISEQNQIIYKFPEDYNYTLLSDELSKLKNKVDEKILNSTDDTDRSDISTAVLKAQKAAKQKDGNAILKNLKIGGEWLLDTAKELTSSIAADVIKKSMGM